MGSVVACFLHLKWEDPQIPALYSSNGLWERNSICGGTVIGEENDWVPIQINTWLLRARLRSWLWGNMRDSPTCVAAHQKLEPASAYYYRSFCFTVQRINKLAFQLWRRSIQPKTQAQPPCFPEEGSPNSMAKKPFVLRQKCCMLNLEPIQSCVLLPAGTMVSLSTQPSHILKVIPMGNLPQPRVKHISFLIKVLNSFTVKGQTWAFFGHQLGAVWVTWVFTFLVRHSQKIWGKLLLLCANQVISHG